MKFGSVYKKGNGTLGTISYNETSSNGRFDIYESISGKWIVYGNIIGNNVYIYDAENSNIINGNLNGNRINFSSNQYEIDYAIL